VIEVDDVVAERVPYQDKIADELSVERDFELEGVLDGADRGDGVYRRADAAEALGEEPAVARVAALPSTSTSILRWPSIRVMGSMMILLLIPPPRGQAKRQKRNTTRFRGGMMPASSTPAGCSPSGPEVELRRPSATDVPAPDAGRSSPR
jgi:hypothetical protein